MLCFRSSQQSQLPPRSFRPPAAIPHRHCKSAAWSCSLAWVSSVYLRSVGAPIAEVAPPLLEADARRHRQGCLHLVPLGRRGSVGAYPAPLGRASRDDDQLNARDSQPRHHRRDHPARRDRGNLDTEATAQQLAGDSAYHIVRRTLAEEPVVGAADAGVEIYRGLPPEVA